MIEENKEINQISNQDKNYVNIVEGEEEANLGENITIHTMPRRYKATEVTSQKNSAKGTGFIILLVGFIFLVFAFFVIYFSFIKKGPQFDVSPEINETNQSNDQSQTDNQKQDKEEQKTDLDDLEVDNVSSDDAVEKYLNDISSIDDKDPASSTKTIEDINSSFVDPIDSDRDGLSDYEELIFTSSPHSEDTDSDTYPDKDEVMNLYDPISGGKLIDNVNIEKYLNKEFAFSFYVSKLWTVEAISGNESLIVDIGRGQFIQIISDENNDFDSFDEMYMDYLGINEIDPSLRITNGEWQGIKSDTGLNVYLEHPVTKNVIVFNYVIGDDNTLYYKNIFDLMIKSLEVISE